VEENRGSILVVEDDELWRTAVSDALAEAGFGVRACADGMAAVNELRAEIPDLVLMDLYLPKVDGRQLCGFIKRHPDFSAVRTVVLSGALVGGLPRDALEDADAAVAKGSLQKALPRVVAVARDLLHDRTSDDYRYSIVEPEAIRPRELTRKLAKLKDYIDTLHREVADVLCEIDGERRILRLNPSGLKLVGRPEYELLGEDLLDVLRLPHDGALARAIATTLESDSAPSDTVAEFGFGGRQLEATVSRMYYALRDEGAIVVARDITERRRIESDLRDTEAQLRQAQKMQAIGRLAGGVAHDFNNLLTGIGGYARLALGLPEVSEKLQRYLERIETTADQAANLTKQLLAIARRQVVRPEVVELNEIVRRMGEILERLISGDIVLTASLEKQVGRVRVDPGQVEQILMNLVVNARDAMPDGGRIAIRTKRVEVDRPIARHSWFVKPGPYLALSVSDTGHGMEEETISRIFEPFFTTKEEGKGSGLGLSTVYGIIRQAGGDITVESRIGRGSTFTVYLPQHDGPISRPAEEPRVARPTGGSETILVAEDSEQVRDFVADTLQQKGYQVRLARNGAEALERLESGEDRIDLLLTDLVMPKIGGRELARRLGEIAPDRIKILYMSGYLGGDTGPVTLEAPPTPMLTKPFSPEDLLLKVREVLDG